MWPLVAFLCSGDGSTTMHIWAAKAGLHGLLNKKGMKLEEGFEWYEMTWGDSRRGNRIDAISLYTWMKFSGKKMFLGTGFTN